MSGRKRATDGGPRTTNGDRSRHEATVHGRVQSQHRHGAGDAGVVEKVGAAGVFGPGFDSTNASTTTDTKGRYTFTALPAGTYTVTITACTAGPYLARTITGVQVIGGQITTQNATLASA